MSHVYPRERAPQLRLEPRVFLASGEEVVITLVCPLCHRMRPLRSFGLRRLRRKSGFEVRNCPWCKDCRSMRSP